MALAATPVDAELAQTSRPDLIRSSNVVVQGSDYESPAVLGYAESPADQAEDENPGRNADPSRQGPAEQDYNTPNPSRLRRVRWIDGFQFWPEDCDGGHIVDPCQLGSNADPADTESHPIVGPIQPFVIEASEKCSTFGMPHDYELARAQRKLLAVQSKVLEAEFWSGTKAISQGWTNNQYLVKNTAGDDLTELPIGNPGGALGVIDGLAALEQAIADGSAWARGVIHCTPRLATEWIAEHLVENVGGPGTTLMTRLGTVVIAGGGYPGTGAGAVHATHYQYAIATPTPQIRLGEITFNETDDDIVAVDRALNDRYIRAARFAAVTFSPCFRAGVLVNLQSQRATPGS